ncbi:uncharacterized protein LOC132261098 [Phlebotomus argentipes]|uniref:uncharacterized protein LOC132261098 n=1 Tax=Phlebotomus argentipes TaxID=94469 RepID=UPI0028934ABC|nr:uncharacterized protein LOC132261098 [Phlebotomus argentipes]
MRDHQEKLDLREQLKCFKRKLKKLKRQAKEKRKKRGRSRSPGRRERSRHRSSPDSSRRSSVSSRDSSRESSSEQPRYRPRDRSRSPIASTSQLRKKSSSISERRSVELTSSSESEAKSATPSPSKTGSVSPEGSVRPEDQKDTADHVTEAEQEILNILGENLYGNRQLAPDVIPNLAMRFEEIVEKGLPEESVKELLLQLTPPKNCLRFEPPVLNQLVKIIMHDAIVARDDKIVKRQQKITSALSAVTRVIVALLKEKALPGWSELMTLLAGAGKLLSDLQHDESVIRRNLVIANVDVSMRDAFQSTTTDEFLFGKDLEETVKTTNEVNEEAATTPSTSTAIQEIQRQPRGEQEVISPSLINVRKPAGRLQFFSHAWNDISSDKVILSWLKGYEIPFNNHVIQDNPPSEDDSSASELAKIKDLVEQLISKGAVEECYPEKNHFISKIFLIPKPDGSNRFIINLKRLNEFIDAPHFKMEDGRTVIRLMSENCYMASIDIKDAYYLIPIHETHKKYLRFLVKGTLYQFTCMPFGLNVAPYVFTKIMKPVVSALRQQGITLVAYLDDLWIMGKSYSECAKSVRCTEELLINLGFIINYEKSKLKPSRICRFLGVDYNSLNMTVELPNDKKAKIRKLTSQFKANHEYKIQKFAEMLGFLVSCCPAVKYGLVYTKACERLKFLALLRSKGNYNGKLSINQEVMKELTWWNTIGSSSFNPIRNPHYDLTIFTDASKSGWGAAYKGERAHGSWKEEEKDLSINFLELTAAFFGLKCFADRYKDSQILLRIDNTTAISYINRMGGVQREDLSFLAKKIWRWCEKRNIYIFASYITSEENVEADLESRKLEANTEFELSEAGFRKIRVWENSHSLACRKSLGFSSEKGELRAEGKSEGAKISGTRGTMPRLCMIVISQKSIREIVKGVEKAMENAFKDVQKCLRKCHEVMYIFEAYYLLLRQRDLDFIHACKPIGKSTEMNCTKCSVNMTQG